MEQIIYKTTDTIAMKNKLRFERELHWIKNLQTPYPLGLNDNIYMLGNISRHKSIDIFDLFHRKKRNNRSHGIKKNGNIKRKMRQRLTVRDCHNIFSSSGKHRLLSRLANLSIKSLRTLDEEAGNIFLRSNPLYYTASIIQLYTSHKLKPHIDKEEDHKRHFFKLQFINKGMDFINLASIFNDKQCIKLIPKYFNNTETPIISYKCNKSVRSYIFNYNQLVSDIDVDIIDTHKSCNCIESTYCYKPVGHVVTGNFNILGNKSLIDIFSKGPKYRLPLPINFIDCIKEITDTLNTFTETWCKREQVELNALNRWKQFILDKVSKRVEFYLANPHLLPPELNYSLSNLKYDLTNFHSTYVFVPADKAANNIIII